MGDEYQQIETQVRRDFRRKQRAQVLLTGHALIIMTFFIFWIQDINPESTTVMMLVTLVPLTAHLIWFYYSHGKGKINREARIHAEIKRRQELIAMQSEVAHYDAYTNNLHLMDDGEFYPEDEFTEMDNHKLKRR